jgi:folate-binding Fe-S cluster repair protein YgfZ
MEDIQAYEAALHTTAYYCQPMAGCLHLKRADRVDFLQRQTTNDLRKVNAEQTVTTILTSPTARVLDMLCIMDEGESLGVITLPGRNAETEQFLRSRIFFSDQVDLKNVSSDFGQILLLEQGYCTKPFSEM